MRPDCMVTYTVAMLETLNSRRNHCLEIVIGMITMFLKARPLVEGLDVPALPSDFLLGLQARGGSFWAVLVVAYRMAILISGPAKNFASYAFLTTLSRSAGGAAALHTSVRTYPLLEALDILSFVVPFPLENTIIRLPMSAENGGVAVSRWQRLVRYNPICVCQATRLESWRKSMAVHELEDLHLTHMATGCADSRRAAKGHGWPVLDWWWITTSNFARLVVVEALTIEECTWHKRTALNWDVNVTEALEGRAFDSAKPTVVVDEIVVMEPYDAKTRT
ncbi:uncharacterized protein F5147DRAFT_762182 [Suillus discolor]|uniref:Uncharacterized protein n=1 Tax=Suillus discolor TaxID=1912936 RepID=A0A9P7F2F4_9AGAM|nr:uncharacterized protein F5147DRAFT_762182 [Suillus discolor]KAG2104015.1 hypothetical protein F5147DRAFT_762182 [Suillus discolor]